ATGIAIQLATGANALETTKAVKETIDNLRPFFPPGMDVVYPFETAPVVSASIEGVVHTLFEAIVLVFLVMYLFLQNFRATLIPTLAVPVVLLGTFGVLAAFGFSVNILTMFALVLSAVFVPMAFFGGSTGVIYRQFAITIASAMTLSVLVALIFTPALCATMLKPIPKGSHHEKRGFFGWFNRTFNRGVSRYERG